MSKKLSNQEFKNKIKKKYGEEFELLSDYDGATKKIVVKHKCGNIREVAPYSLLSGTKCPMCSNRVKRTTESFQKEIDELYNGEYELLEEYVNTNTYIRIKHKNCGLVKKYKPKEFKKGIVCKCKKERLAVVNFKKKLKEVLNDEYEMLEDYINAKTVIKFKHKCGNIIETQPTNLIRGKTGCRECNGKKEALIEKNKNAFIKKINKKFNREYELLSEYLNSKEVATFIHKPCGTVFTNKPTHVLNSIHGSCPSCSSEKRAEKRRQTQEEFESRVREVVGDEYKILGKYVNNSTKILAKHNSEYCNSYFMLHPADFLNSKNPTRCPVCAKKNAGNYHKLDTSTFKMKVREIHGDEYVVVGEYINARTKIDILHKKCQEIIQVIPDSILNRGCGCKSCKLKESWLNNPKRLTTEIFKERVYTLVGEEYEVVGEYLTYEKEVKMKHNLCGYEFNVIAANFLGTINKRGTRCPLCNESFGEERIRIYLQNNNLEFEKEYKFDDLVGLGGRQLRFDFAIFKEGKLFALCEYDGILHYKVANIGDLKKIKEHDKRKNDYCKNNHIKLIRIKYKDFDNIEDILLRKIKSKLISS